MGGIDGGRETKRSFAPGTAGGGTSGVTRVAGSETVPMAGVPPALPTHSEATDSGMGSSSSSRLCRIQ